MLQKKKKKKNILSIGVCVSACVRPGTRASPPRHHLPMKEAMPVLTAGAGNLLAVVVVVVVVALCSICAPPPSSCTGLHETLALLTSQLRPDANHKEDMVFLKDVFSERSLGYLMKVMELNSATSAFME